MALNVDTNTRLALRAAVAALVGVLIARLLARPHSYWVLLTAVVLVSDTSGENLQRALARFLMTVLGTLAGSVLYLFARESIELRVALLLTAVFLAIYFRSGVPRASFRPMVFFLTVYVVFLFAIIGEWNAHVMIERIYDTAIGGAIAWTVAQVVLPQRATEQVQSELAQLWRECREEVDRSFDLLLADDGSPPRDDPARKPLLERLEQVRNQLPATAYERFRGGASRSEREELLWRAELLCRYALALDVAAEQPQARIAARLLRPTLDVCAERIRAGLEKARQTSHDLRAPDRLHQPTTLPDLPMDLHRLFRIGESAATT